MSRISKTIEVGATDYDILPMGETEIKKFYMSNPEGDEDDDPGYLFGFTDFKFGYIFVDANLLKEQKRQTFFHELTHVFLDEIGADEMNSDEGFVEALSKQIYGFFKKNNLQEIYDFLEEH